VALGGILLEGDARSLHRIGGRWRVDATEGHVDADNVVAAIAAVRPAGVDSKTKTDRADGNGKDLDKVRRFVTAAKLTTSTQ